jgi:hypothetical protein
MGSVPHRDFTWIERTAAPAFSESRAGNRRDPLDEDNHDFGGSMPQNTGESHEAFAIAKFVHWPADAAISSYTQPPSTM